MSMSFEELVLAIEAEDSFVVATHVAPDPDAIGSAVALALGLRTLGKQAVVYLGENIPARISWAVPEGVVVNEVPTSEENFSAVICDTATKGRISGEGELLLAQASSSINIDHHVSNTQWADSNYIEAESASTAGIVFELLQALDVAVSPNIATLLLMGIVDDTGSFRFSNTSATTLERAARLVRFGASPAEIANHLYFSIPRRQMSLRVDALEGLEFACHGALAIVVVDTAMFERHGATAEDAEGIVDAVRAIAGVRVAVFARQMDEDAWKLSLRSSDPAISILEVAAAFGGGGHPMASGAKVSGSISQIKEKLVSQITPLLNVSK